MNRRVHIVVLEPLIAEIDRLVGKRGRSAFVTDLILKEVKKRQLLQALDEIPDVFASSKYEHWKDPVKWVHDLRQQDVRLEQGRLKKKTGQSETSARLKLSHRRPKKGTRAS